MKIGAILNAVLIAIGIRPAEPASATTAESAVKRTELKTAAPNYERDRKRAWRAKQAERKRASSCPDVVRDTSGTCPGHVPDAPKEREEQKIERGAPIAENWRPDAEGLRLAGEAFGNQAEAEIAGFHDYWRARAGPTALQHDFQAKFRWWVRERSKQLSLPLAARPSVVTITGDRNGTFQRHGQYRRRSAGNGNKAALDDYIEGLERKIAGDGEDRQDPPGVARPAGGR
jgi:hypothetical protein